MRPAFRLLRAVAALGGAAALVVPGLTGPAAAAEVFVQVGEDGVNRFRPATVRIKPGDTVTWQYAGGTGHTVTSTTANWDKDEEVGPPGGVLTIQTSYLFDAPGTYRYVCRTHEDEGMKGTVVVEGTKPKPTASRTPTRSPSPTSTRTSAPPSESPSPPDSPSPSPSVATASPDLPTAPPLPSETATPPPLPTVAPTPSVTFALRTDGLTPQPGTNRELGLPAMLALLLIGGVGAAEIRAFLANAP